MNLLSSKTDSKDVGGGGVPSLGPGDHGHTEYGGQDDAIRWTNAWTDADPAEDRTHDSGGLHGNHPTQSQR